MGQPHRAIREDRGKQRGLLFTHPVPVSFLPAAAFEKSVTTDKRITIRGERLTSAVRSTLVHELTHVLQDQHFAVGDRMKNLRKKSGHGESTSEASVLDAIIEGDAVRVETLYRDSLTPKQRQASTQVKKTRAPRPARGSSRSRRWSSP